MSALFHTFGLSITHSFHVPVMGFYLFNKLLFQTIRILFYIQNGNREEKVKG
jgi:hypothetical protein